MERGTKIAIGVGIAIGAGLLLSRRGGSMTSVVEAASSIPNGGTYAIAGSGSPIDIVFKGATILPKGHTVYCSGFTFAVVMLAAKARGLLDDKSVEQVRRFQRSWYGGANGSEDLSGSALRELGIGGPVPQDEAQPGDFVQLWRTDRSGHSVVFLDWEYDSRGNIIGMKWRAAGTRSGVGNGGERFQGLGGSVILARTYFSRLT